MVRPKDTSTISNNNWRPVGLQSVESFSEPAPASSRSFDTEAMAGGSHAVKIFERTIPCHYYKIFLYRLLKVKIMLTMPG